MLLHEVNRHGAVELFLRQLQYSFPRRDIVGLPGAMAGIPDVFAEDSLARLIHELEHVTQLSYPVGSLLSALGLRAHDLHNHQAKGLMALRNTYFNEGGVVDRKASLAVLDGARAAFESARTLQAVAELFKPLLEGLALASEMELSVSLGDHLSSGAVGALNLEMLHFEHKIELRGKEGFFQGLSEDPKFLEIVLKEVFPYFASQVAFARKMRSKAFRNMLWGGSTKEEDEHIEPYLVGYLYLRKLNARWRRILPTLSDHDFYRRATKLVCLMLPVRLLPLLSVSGAENSRDLDRTVEYFSALLQSALDYSHSDILRLDSPALLADLLGAQAGPTSDGSAVPDLVNLWLSHLVHVVLGHNEADEGSTESFEFLFELEQVKPILPVALKAVALLGYDARSGCLLLVDRDRDADADRRVTYVKMEPGTLTRMWSATGIDPGKLNPFTIGQPPYPSSTKNLPPDFWLATFLKFSNGAYMSQMRILFDSKKTAFVAAPTSDDLMKLLPSLNQFTTSFLPGVYRALDPRHGLVRQVFEEIAMLCADADVATVAREVAALFDREDRQLPANAWSRRAYLGLLFPGLVGRSANLGVHVALREVRDSISHDDLAALNRWVREGLMLHSADDGPPHVGTATAGPDGALERIQEVSRRILGVDLVERTAQGIELSL